MKGIEYSMQKIIKKYKVVILLLAVITMSVLIYQTIKNTKKPENAVSERVKYEELTENETNIVIDQQKESASEPETDGSTEAPAPENLKEGTEHSSVADLQARLMELGFMENDEPTMFYGPVTADAVRAFQRQNNLAQDGITGPVTLASIMSPEAKYYAISLGIAGEDVKRVQNRLYELGYLTSENEVNATFDALTEGAVIKLQEVNQLSVDGKVGQKTINLLYSEEVKPNLLAYGEKNEVVLSSQKRLKELGYLTTVPDGDYGKDTVQAVKQFQSRNGLVVDGYLGPSTRVELRNLEATPNGLVIGEEGEGVERVQNLLSKHGYLPSGNVTGYYGEITEKAVKTFQENNRLTADGTVGIRTMAALTGDDVVKAKAGSSSGSGKGSADNKTGGGGTFSGNVQALLNVAASKVGSKYIWGAKGPNSFDCSGFIYWSLNQIGVRQSYLTSSGWRTIGKYKKITDYDDIQPGDIVIEKGHMGIAAENGKVIDASSGNGKVVYRQRTKWWRDNFIVAWRIF